MFVLGVSLVDGWIVVCCFVCMFSSALVLIPLKSKSELIELITNKKDNICLFRPKSLENIKYQVEALVD